MDTSRSVSGAMDKREEAAAGKFVDLMLLEQRPKDAKQGDQAFLIHFDQEVELLEDFTNSRDKLHTELDGMGPTAREREYIEWPGRRAATNRIVSSTDRVAAARSFMTRFFWLRMSC